VLLRLTCTGETGNTTSTDSGLDDGEKSMLQAHEPVESVATVLQVEPSTNITEITEHLTDTSSYQYEADFNRHPVHSEGKHSVQKTSVFYTRASVLSVTTVTLDQ